MKFYLIIFIGIVVFSSGCIRDGKVIPDVSKIQVDVKIKRFEKDFFSIDTNKIAQELDLLEKKYPKFSDIFFNNVIKSTDKKFAPEGHLRYVEGFLKHPALRYIYDTCSIVYKNMDDVEEEFEQAFRFLKYYFPDMPTPDITTFISEYTIGTFIYDDVSLAVGLDFFLGSDYPYLKYNHGNPNFSDYLTRTFNKDHLVAKTLNSLIDDLAGNPSGNKLLDIMINNGKKIYLLDHLLPYASDTIKLEYSPEQLKWCNDNELDIWTYFIKEDLLYSSEWKKIRKYVNYSPNSPGMPPEAPGRTGNWLGWQIVKAYMKHFPETSMQNLIELQDAQDILDKSRYKPARD